MKTILFIVLTTFIMSVIISFVLAYTNLRKSRKCGNSHTVRWFVLSTKTSDSFSIKEPRQVIHFTLSGFLFTKSAQEEYFFSLTGLPFCR